MYLDARIVPPDELESSAPYLERLVYSEYDLGMKKREFLRFVKATTGQILWSSDLVCEVKSEINEMNQDLRPCSILFLVTSVILFLGAYFFSTISFLVELAILPIIGILYIAFYFFVYVIIDLHLFTDGWTENILESDSVQLEQSMVEILSLLQSNFSFPLRFHLAKEYPILVYTGLTQTTRTLVKLKEAILYPKNPEEKEESTGAL